MKTITFNISETVDIDEQEAKMMLAANLYKKGKVSLGQAAEMAGYTKRTFMELLGSLDVPLFDLTQADIENDIANAKNGHS
jgi:predicted HTH domain antitoxin